MTPIRKIDSVFLSTHALDGDFALYVDIYEMNKCYLQYHRASGYLRTTVSKDGIQAYGDFFKDKTISDRLESFSTIS